MQGWGERRGKLEVVGREWIRFLDMFNYVENSIVLGQVYDSLAILQLRKLRKKARQLLTMRQIKNRKNNSIIISINLSKLFKKPFKSWEDKNEDR